MRGIFLPDEQLSFPQEGLCSMELVDQKLHTTKSNKIKET
jgi:hypothetical protein